MSPGTGGCDPRYHKIHAATYVPKRLESTQTTTQKLGTWTSQQRES